MRIALGVEYDGSHFNGWQRQKDPKVRTVQTQIEQALSQVADQAINCYCAGRTDAGVHANGQVIHIETEVQRTMHSWIFGCNTYLPADINIGWATPVPDSFHARFSAKQRHYRYIINNQATRSALWSGRATWFYRPLDIALMQTAANHLIGQHDFTSYRAKGCQANSPIRTISQLKISRVADQVIIDISANAFLQHMVRNIAGVLMSIGCGQAESDWSLTILKAKNRSEGGITAPPFGLYLTQVDYPDYQLTTTT